MGRFRYEINANKKDPEGYPPGLVSNWVRLGLILVSVSAEPAPD